MRGGVWDGQDAIGVAVCDVGCGRRPIDVDLPQQAMGRLVQEGIDDSYLFSAAGLCEYWRAAAAVRVGSTLVCCWYSLELTEKANGCYYTTETVRVLHLSKPCLNAET